MSITRIEQAQAIVRICRKLDSRNYTPYHFGNVSVRLDEYIILATPTSESKGDITPEMILVLDRDGKKVEGAGKPFSEIRLHIAAYRARPGIRAVIHAHPPCAEARGLAGKPLDIHLPEAVIALGDHIPVAGYTAPGSQEQIHSVEEMAGCCDIFLMTGNGVLSLGRDLTEAYLRIELLEHLLMVDAQAAVFGPPQRLPDDDRAGFMEKRASLGLGPTSSPAVIETPARDNLKETVRKLIIQEIEDILPK